LNNSHNLASKRSSFQELWTLNSGRVAG
jgi:hypothetical protein